MGKPTERFNVLDNASLGAGNTQFQQQWPLGEGWYALLLRFNIVLTIGTGSGALTEALQRIIENILITTDRDGVIVNASGRALWRLAQFKAGGVPPVADAFSAATGTYRVEIPIYFADPLALRPEDTILDTSRYSSLNVTITMGGVSRLLSTVGTSSVTYTVDADIERARGPLSENSKPIFTPFIVNKPSVDPNSQAFVDLERARDLAYKRIMLFASDNSTPWQGGADSAVLDKISIEDSDGFVGLRSVKDDCIQRANVRDYRIDAGAIITGLYMIDFTKQRSIQDAEWSGAKSRFQVTWTNDTPSSKYVHTLIEGVRTLKE